MRDLDEDARDGGGGAQHAHPDVTALLDAGTPTCLACDTAPVTYPEAAPELVTYPESVPASGDLRESESGFAFSAISHVTPAGSQDWTYWRHLRRRFLKGGLEALDDQEILEIFLAISSPRPRRQATLAKALTDRFGNLAGVVGADPRNLFEFSADNRRAGYLAIALLKAVHVTAVRLLRGEVVNRPILVSSEAVAKYCMARMAFRLEEQFCIMFLNRKNMLIVDELQQQGTVDHVPLYPREVAKRALELGASAIVMVHNHPSGDPAPSEADITMTKQVVAALKLFEISVHDHIIIGLGRYVSLRSSGHF